MRLPFLATATFAIVLASTAAAPAADPAGMSPAADQRALLTSRTNGYFDAVRSGDYRSLAAFVTPDYRMVGTNGAVRGSGDVVGAATAINLESSKPIGSIGISAVSVTGTTATETVDVGTYVYAFLGYGNTVVRRYSTHALTWSAGADGIWRVSQDRVTADNTYY